MFGEIAFFEESGHDRIRRLVIAAWIVEQNFAVHLVPDQVFRLQVAIASLDYLSYPALPLGFFAIHLCHERLFLGIQLVVIQGCFEFIDGQQVQNSIFDRHWVGWHAGDQRGNVVGAHGLLCHQNIIGRLAQHIHHRAIIALVPILLSGALALQFLPEGKLAAIGQLRFPQ